jgi:hypothetical protein
VPTNTRTPLITDSFASVAAAGGAPGFALQSRCLIIEQNFYFVNMEMDKLRTRGTQYHILDGVMGERLSNLGRAAAKTP